MSLPRGLGPSLDAGACALGVALSPCARDTLLAYVALLARWNRAYNLTAVRDPGQMVTRHLLDCLAIVPLVRGVRLLDVGSGAGLPGLVLAVAMPTLRVTLLDSSLKRTRFLSHVVRELGLAPVVEVVRGRVENHRPGVGYDTVTSRASLPLQAMVKIAPGLLAPGGRLVAMLGQADGVRDLCTRPSWRLTLEPLAVPGLGAARHAAILEARE